jgi:alcohol dehydrogenase
MPVHFFLGRDVLKRNGELMLTLGKKPLLVTGKNSAKKCGALDDVISVLNLSGMHYTHFDEVKENPDLETVVKGAKLLQQTECDFIIAIGGGSPLDAGKAISALAKNDLLPYELYESAKIKDAYKIVAVPTTAGTGSELTPYSVITNTEINQKAGFGSSLLYPALSYIDAKYTLTLSKEITRDTSIDALSHLLEGLYSDVRHSFFYPLIFQGIKLIYQFLPLCLEELDNLEYRVKLMHASMLGGYIISQCGTTLQHSLGYPLTTELGLSHGLANGVVMKIVMEKFYPSVSTELDSMFKYLKIGKNDFYSWLDMLGIKFEHDLDDLFIKSKSYEVLNSRNMAKNPCKIELEEIQSLYKNLSKS